MRDIIAQTVPKTEAADTLADQTMHGALRFRTEGPRASTSSDYAWGASYGLEFNANKDNGDNGLNPMADHANKTEIRPISVSIPLLISY